MNMKDYIIGGVIALIVLGIVAYYVARFMKGRLRLDLGGKTLFRSNDRIEGDVTLKIKQATRGLLKISLVGFHEVRKGRTSSGGISTTWQEFFREDEVLEEEKDFQPGFVKSYGIGLAVPTSSQVHVSQEAYAETHAGLDPAILPEALKTLVEKATANDGYIRNRIRWKVEGRLDADGVDLFTSQRIRLDLTD